MTEHREIIKFAIDELVRLGAEKAQCQLIASDKYVFRQETGRIAMLRTIRNTSLTLSALCDNRLARITINRIGKTEISDASAKLVASAATLPQDAAQNIAETQPAEIFDNGLAVPDLKGMYTLVAELIAQTGRRYPTLSFHNISFDFTRETKSVINTNGVDLSSGFGKYSLTIPFNARKDKKVSASNYILLALKDLHEPLNENPVADELLRQGVDQVNAKPVNGNFTGDIIIHPYALDDFIYYLALIALKDAPLLEGNSVYQDKLGKQIADKRLSLHSRPAASELADGYFITADGYKAQNVALIDRGILKTFLLSRYGATKTGFIHSRNDGNCYVADAGETSLADMIKSVKKGVLLTRFSCATPNRNGDFSGAVKQGCYIEDGELKYPISETMISGNIPQMLMNINAISRERINNGSNLYPWISCSVINISGQ